jgi:hypothetical protein|tara:strand:+ start:815 stop:1012 length:198 start_codon:yes stop_codon:yes gene_type:complete
MKNLSLFMGKIRPQIFLALCILGVVAILGMSYGLNEVTVGCIAGIIALAKDVLAVDNSDSEGGGE